MYKTQRLPLNNNEIDSFLTYFGNKYTTYVEIIPISDLFRYKKNESKNLSSCSLKNYLEKISTFDEIF